MKACEILMIDDDEDDVEILAHAFLQSGVRAVHHVPTAMEAFMFLEAMEHESLPKLIITDHFLPGISGKEFLSDLRAMKKYQHLPVVVLATAKTDEEIEQYENMGILDYLLKPSSYDEYVEVAERIKARAFLGTGLA